MLKFLFISIIFFSTAFSNSVQANDIYKVFKFLNKNPKKQLGTAPGVQCSSEEIVLRTKPRFKGDKHYFSMKCLNFIGYKSQYGSYGKIIKEYIDEQGGASSLFMNDDIPGMITDPGTCPNWKSFSYETKMKFWVWTMASIAMVESSCDSLKVNMGQVPDPTDRPRGLLQLNTLKSNRSWRGPNCQFSSAVLSVLNPRNNLRCGLDIMNELLKGKDGEYQSNGKLYPTNSYWEKLRGDDSIKGPISILIKQFPEC
jgi:hypothetical protein